MIRNLKVLVAAAMALGALGAVGASGAHAAVEFHCSVEPCTGTLKPDEVANTKTSHHVFIIENAALSESVSFTCGALDGEVTVNTKTVASAEAKNLSYTECLVNGSGKMTVDMNGCKYNFTAAGTVTITGCTNAAKQIEITIASCSFDIPEQGPLSTISYHNVGISPNREVTVSANVHKIKVVATGTKATCFINPEQTLEGTYTTGNTIVTGETEAGVMADAWWA
jgi:hypothetical protein